MKRLLALEILTFMTETIVVLAMDKNAYDRIWLMAILVLWFISDMVLGYLRGNSKAQYRRRQRKGEQMRRNGGSPQQVMQYEMNLHKKDIRSHMLFDQMILDGVPFRQACIRRMIRGAIMGAILVLLWRII